jgi:acyl phosphate:glycerol-3-phosphate acyltransferase
MSDTLFAAIAFGYLLGSVPFGLLLTRLGGHGDVREIGSGNIGATNVLRTGNKGLALITLLLDGAKGAAAYLIVKDIDPEVAAYAGLAAFIGHIYPVWLKFRGGKGVATWIGLLLAFSVPLGVATMATWLVSALIFRMSSLAALVAAALAPVYAWYLGNPTTAFLLLIMAVIIFFRHRENIRRIRAGEESKIGSNDA